MVAEGEGEVYRFPCVRADLATLPFWFSEMLEKNLAMMEEVGRVYLMFS